MLILGGIVLSSVNLRAEGAGRGADAWNVVCPTGGVDPGAISDQVRR